MRKAHGGSARWEAGRKRPPRNTVPPGTGCPVVEEAVARLYRDQSEAHFWDLMNALNYALELKTRVLVPLDAATDPQSGAAPWAALPIPEEKAEDLPPWLLHTRRERTYLPLFTSVKTAEAERTTATRPMAERGMREAMTIRPEHRRGWTAWSSTRGRIPPRWTIPS